MTASSSLKEIAWNRILFIVLLILIPNFLIMQFEVAGPANDLLGLASAIDLILVLPLAIYFFGFKKRKSVIILLALIFWGMLLANWIIPNKADFI